MTFEELKDKALSLPLAPGVYLMRDQNGTVIYVGKAKKLKNRVSQYFQDTASHTPKTRLMVSKIRHFDVIVAASEFEALVLECSLIKRYMPKYNILLKDDKGYPYLRLDKDREYPSITMVSKPNDDKAEYFGPYGSRGVTQDVLDAIGAALKLPACKKQFPRDIGKDRVCLNYHMNRCEGWCQGNVGADEYRERIEQARKLMQGNYKALAAEIKEQMIAAAENLEFERAAGLRDRLNAIENLGRKQLVTTATLADTDVIGYAENEAKGCFAVLHFSGGNLLDKDYEIFALPDNKEAAVSSLLKQYYVSRGFAPRVVMLPFQTDDAELLAQLLEEKSGKKTRIFVPQRGEKLRIVELACKNAMEEVQRVTDKSERMQGALTLLGNMLSMNPPKRIESYDISHISGTDIVAGMVVFNMGKPYKSGYRRFALENMSNQNDYACMRQVLLRRFSHFKAGDAGFDAAPDLLLIDGGVAHACVALEALHELELDFPVFGMVKDDRHRTRALVTPEGMEIRIDNNQAVFSFVGTIQEEVHRFAISFHRQKRSRRLEYSELDRIEGVGPKRKALLLKQYKSISAIKEASLAELERILPKDAAHSVYQHFREKEENRCE